MRERNLKVARFLVLILFIGYLLYTVIGAYFNVREIEKDNEFCIQNGGSVVRGGRFSNDLCAVNETLYRVIKSNKGRILAR